MSLFSISLIIAGVSMVWFEMPLLLVSLHNGLAAGLLICSVQLLHRLTPQSAAPL
jgi:heme A synthase